MTLLLNPQDQLAALAHRERQIDAIRRMSDALFSHLTVDDMVRETLVIAIDVLRADAGSVQLYNPVDDTLIFRYVVSPVENDLTGYAMPAAQGIAGKVFRSGVPDLAHQVQERAEFNATVDRTTGYTTKSMMTVPVKRLSGAPIGVMQILNSQTRFDRRDLEVLEVLSSQAASAIEHARLANEAKQAEVVNVIGDVAHDIKNMLTPIHISITMLEPMLGEFFRQMNEEMATADPELQEKWKRYSGPLAKDYGWMLKYALDSADKVQTRTKQIADAVKGELSPPHFEEGDLNDVARDVCRSLRPYAEKQNVILKPDLDHELPHTLFDSRQMYNALYNLVNNAIPETTHGGSVTVRTHRPNHEGVVVVEVQDTGRGMPEEVRAKLFTDSAVSTKPGGTGLGTRIVAGVIQRHQGTIDVRSEAEVGTTFTIRLPMLMSIGD